MLFLLHLPLDKSGNALADKMPTAGTPLSAGFANGDGWALLGESNLGLGLLFTCMYIIAFLHMCMHYIIYTNTQKPMAP